MKNSAKRKPPQRTNSNRRRLPTKEPKNYSPFEGAEKPVRSGMFRGINPRIPATRLVDRPIGQTLDTTHPRSSLVHHRVVAIRDDIPLRLEQRASAECHQLLLCRADCSCFLGRRLLWKTVGEEGEVCARVADTEGPRKRRSSNVCSCSGVAYEVSNVVWGMPMNRIRGNR